MKKISETGIDKYTEEIGSDGTMMYIRVETTAEGKQINAPVKKGDKTVATLSSEVNGSVFLSISKDTDLSSEEFFDLFAKSAEVVAEIRGIPVPNNE